MTSEQQSLPPPSSSYLADEGAGNLLNNNDDNEIPGATSSSSNTQEKVYVTSLQGLPPVRASQVSIPQPVQTVPLQPPPTMSQIYLTNLPEHTGSMSHVSGSVLEVNEHLRMNNQAAKEILRNREQSNIRKEAQQRVEQTESTYQNKRHAWYDPNTYQREYRPWWFVIGLDFANSDAERSKSVDVYIADRILPETSPTVEKKKEFAKDKIRLQNIIKAEHLSERTLPHVGANEVEDIDGIQVMRTPMPVVTADAGKNKAKNPITVSEVTNTTANNNNNNNNNPTVNNLEPPRFLGVVNKDEDRVPSTVDRPVSDSFEYNENAELGKTSSPNNNNNKNKETTLPTIENQEEEPELYVGSATVTPGGDDEVIRKDTTISQNNKLTVDFHVAVRKFILFNTIFIVIAITALILASLNDFYAARGYGINGVIIGLLFFGLLVGIRAQIWSYSKRLAYLHMYWLLCVIFLFLFFLAAIVAVAAFVNRYNSICEDLKHCRKSSVGIATAGAVVTALCWLVLGLFYIDLVSRLVVIGGQFYDLWAGQIGIMYLIHKYAHKFHKWFRNVRQASTNNLGTTLNDLLYCTCLCQSCMRATSDGWKPVQKEYTVSSRTCCRCFNGVSCVCCGANTGQAHKDVRRASYDSSARRPIVINCNCSPTLCECCLNCLFPICSSADYCCEGLCDWSGSCLGTLCKGITRTCCCQSDGVPRHANSKDMCNTLCCNYGEQCCPKEGPLVTKGDGECILLHYLIGGVFLLLLFPIVLFGALAIPFWLLAEWIVSRMHFRTKYWIIVTIMVLSLVPPFIIWNIIFINVCSVSTDDSEDVVVLCYLWSIFTGLYH